MIEVMVRRPARPPSAAATKPRATVVQRPTSGETPATKEKATASGTMARHTARPAATERDTVAGYLCTPLVVRPVHPEGAVSGHAFPCTCAHREYAENASVAVTLDHNTYRYAKLHFDDDPCRGLRGAHVLREQSLGVPHEGLELRRGNVWALRICSRGRVGARKAARLPPKSS